MANIDADLEILRAQLEKGHIRSAYVALVNYMSRLRARFAGERGEHMVSGLYQGCFDMTYFALFSDDLKSRDLKIAVVFDYATFSFQVWLAARNRKVQKSCWKLLRDAGYSKHTLVDPGAGIDAIAVSVLADEFSLEEDAVLTTRILAGVEAFERDVLEAVGTAE